MVRIAACLLLTVVAFCSFAAASAPAARQMRTVKFRGEFDTDDSRYAVYREGGQLRVVDTIDHERSVFEFSQIPVEGRCRLGDAHAGLAVINCPDPDEGLRPWVVDLSTLEVVTPSGRPPHGRYGEPLSHDRVGIHWIAALGGIADEWYFWNWRTGEQRFALGSWARVPRNLDTPRLLVRPAHLAAREGRTSVWQRNGRLVLRHRQRRVVLTHDVRPICPCDETVALSDGRVAWIGEKFVHSYRIRDGRRTRWRNPQPLYGPRSERLLLPTRNRLFLLRRFSNTVHAARWPPG